MKGAAIAFVLAVALASPRAAVAAEGPAPAFSTDDGSEREPAVRIGARIAPGYSYRGFFDSALHGGNLALGAGAEFRKGAVYVGVRGFMGGTTGGLRATEFAFGPSWEWRFDALRLGVGQETSYLELPRETQPGHAMWGFGLGVRAFGSYDVFEFERHALYLGLELSATMYFGREDAPGPGVWGPMAVFGFRY